MRGCCPGPFLVTSSGLARSLGKPLQPCGHGNSPGDTPFRCQRLSLAEKPLGGLLNTAPPPTCFSGFRGRCLSAGDKH